MRKLITLSLAALLLFPATAGACTATKWCGKRHSAAYNKRAIREVCAKRHSDLSGLMYLARRESHFGNLATNGPCLGMYQLATKQPKRKWASPYWNTNRAITYCRERYGSVAAAVAHSKRTGWY